MVKTKQERHFRATPQDVLAKWLDGFYTAKGYIHDLLLALRKEGWWFRIESVARFCQEWQISTRTFYAAKAELIAAGKLQENLTNAIEIRVPIALAPPLESVQNSAHRLQDSAQAMQNSAHRLQDSAQLSPETLTPLELYSPTDLYRSNTDLLQEREKAIAVFSEPEPGREQTKPEDLISTADEIQVPDQVSSEPIAAAQDNFSVAAPPNFFDWKIFDYAEFVPGSGTHEAYWEWARSHCLRLQDERKRLNHPSPIGDVNAFTIGCIRRAGADGFKRYLQAIGELPADPKPTPKPRATAGPEKRQTELAQFNRRLKSAFESGGVKSVIAMLEPFASGLMNCPPDPEKVSWAVAQNPQWELRFEAGKITHTGAKADLSDVIAAMQIHLRRLAWDRDRVAESLQQRYGVKGRSQLSDEQLVDFAQWLTGQGVAHAV